MKTTRKNLEARHPRAMQARAEKSMHHRAARAIRQWLIVFILLTAGATTAAADEWKDHGTVEVNGVRYHLYKYDYSYFLSDDRYVACVEAFVGSPTEVTILNEVKNGYTTYKVQGLRWRITGGGAYSYNGERTATIAATSVRRINFEGWIDFYGEAGNPTFSCWNLQEVYFLGGAPSFSGNWYDIFGDRATNTVTAYVKGKTQEQCDALKTNNAVWGGFKYVKPYQETYSCTMSSNGSGEVFVVDLGDYSSFSSSGAQTLPKSLFIASGSSGSKTANLPMGKNYSVVYVNSDPAKIPVLKRNGTAVTLNTVTHGGVKYAYYTETNLQANVTYQWLHRSNTVPVSLTNNTNETVFISELGSYSNFNVNGAQNMPHLIDVNGKGTVSRNRLKDVNYATVYVCSDPTKIPKLIVNDCQSVTQLPVNYVTYNNVQYAYYKLKAPTSNTHYYQWSTTDKTCSVTFIQKQLPDNASKTGTVNVKNGSTQQSFSTATKVFSFSQGSTMELDIPFDQEVQTLSSIKVGGVNILPQAENGHYKATVTVPQSNTFAVELIWNEPIPAPVVQNQKPPKAMVIRTGEGSVTFKGRGNLEVGQDDYEWRDLVTMNCSDPVSYVSIPILDMRDQILEDEDWGFCLEIKPVQGEVLRSLMIGGIDKDNLILTWDNYLNNSAYSNYLSYDAATGTYVFKTEGDYMNFPKGDYTILVDMGPETVTAEERNVQTIVRKGGTGNAKIYYEFECNDREFAINEGSVIVTLPDYGDECETFVHLEIAKVAGEKFTAYRDGEDVTGEFKEFDNSFIYIFDDYSLPISERGRGRHSSSWMILIEKENAEAVQTIPFTDEVVKQICVENWDTDGDGELSFVEAQDVTTIGEVFAGSNIETFDEFKYFTGLSKLDGNNFMGCSNLKSITLPPTITFMECSVFEECTSLEKLELPNALHTLEEAVFNNSGLKEIHIPVNLKSIGIGWGSEFAGPNLELIVIDKEHPVYESGIYNNAIIDKSNDNLLFVLCNKDFAVIPDNVNWLGDHFLLNPLNLRQLVVPVSVNRIFASALANTQNLETLTMKRREPIAFNVDFFGGTAGVPANCQLIVPFGTRDAYIAAGWTEDIFKGGVVEDDSVLDVNQDGSVNMQDVKMVLNKSLD